MKCRKAYFDLCSCMCKYFCFTLFPKRRETKIIPFDWPTDHLTTNTSKLWLCLQMFIPLFAEILVASNGDKIKENSEIVVQPKFYNIISWSPELIIISTIFCAIHKKKKLQLLIGCNFRSFIIFLSHVKCL